MKTSGWRLFFARTACVMALPLFLAASAGATEQFKVSVSTSGTGVDVAVPSLDFGVDTAATDGLDDGTNGTQSLDVPAPPVFIGAGLQFSDVVPVGGTGLVTDFRDASGSKVWTITATGITSGSSVTLTWVSPTGAYLTGKTLTFKGNGADVNMLTATSTTLTANGTYTIVLLDPAATNFPPVAVNDSVSTLVNQAATIDVLANDRDPNGDTLSLTAAGTPAHGGAAIASGKITYTPTTGYSGDDAFTYTVSDGHGKTATGQVAVHVVNAYAVRSHTVSAVYPGQDAVVHMKITHDGSPASLSIQEYLPAATAGASWTYVEGSLSISGATATQTGNTLRFDFTTLPASGTTFTYKVTVPDDAAVGSSAAFAGEVFLNGSSTAHSAIATTVVTVASTPSAPTFSALSPAATGIAVSDIASLPNHITAGQSITFSTSVAAPAGAQLMGSAFWVASAYWDTLETRWWESNAASPLTYRAASPVYIDGAPERDIIAFCETSPVSSINGGNTFSWTKVTNTGTPAAMGVEAGGVRTFTWTTPSTLVTKATPLADRVFYAGIGAITTAGGQGDANWIVRVDPVNQTPVIDTAALTLNGAPQTLTNDTLPLAVEGDTIAITVTAHDPDAADSISYKWEGTSDGGATWDTMSTSATVTAPLSNDMVTHPASSLTGGKAKLRLTVTDNDPANPKSVVRTWTVTTVNDTNQLPTLGTLAATVTPASPTTATASLTCTLTGTAADADTEDVASLKYKYSWYKNSTLFGTPVTATTKSNTLTTDVKKGETWTCKVTVIDQMNGASATTADAAVTVGNTAPTATGQAVTTAEDTAKGVTLAATDPDKTDGIDTLTYAVTQPAHGTVSLAGNVATYTPDLNYNGADSFTFTANDGTAVSAPATVSVTVTAVNDAPTAQAQSVTTDEDTPAGITLAATDPDAGNTLTYTVATPPAHGTLSGTAPNLTYTPALNYNGPDSFSFTAKDNVGAVSSAATVSITVNPVNDAPVISDGSIFIRRGTETAKDFQVTASDVDGDTLTYAILTQGTHGTAVINPATGLLTYTVTDANEFTNDPVVVTVSDGTAAPVSATVNVTYKTNQLPVVTAKSPAADPAIDEVNATGASNSVAFSLTADDTTDPNPAQRGMTKIEWFVDGVLKSTTTTGAPNAIASSYTFTTSGYTTVQAAASKTFTVKATATDVLGGTTDTVWTVTVNNKNRLPTLGTLTAAVTPAAPTTETASLTCTLSGAATDPDAEDVASLGYTYAWYKGGVLAVTHGPTASKTDTLTDDIKKGEAWVCKVSVVDQMGGASATTANSAAVTVGNTAPAATAQAVSTNEDTPLPIVLAGTDPDATDGKDTLTYTVATQPLHGTLSGTAPNLTYTPAANYNGPDSFTFTAKDGTATSTAATVGITVNPVNDAPVATAQAVTTAEDTAASITLAATDVDGDTLTYAVDTPPAHGTLSGTAPGLTYTPDPDYNGTDSFTFTANDGTVTSSPATVAITITPVKDAQTITFGALSAKTAADADFAPGATASSGLPVSYASSNVDVAIIVNGLVRIAGPGETVITASQAGNADYLAATPVVQTLTVVTGQAIDFPNIPAKTYGDADFDPGATAVDPLTQAPSGTPVTYTSSNTAVATITAGGLVHIVGAGTSYITASQAGSAFTVQRLLTVNKAAQTITFGALAAKKVGDADFDPGATASSGLPVTYASSLTTAVTVVNGLLRPVGTGTAVITASQAGNANYLAATAVKQNQAVTAAGGTTAQTITFPVLPAKVYGDADFAPGATASSGLTVTYASSNALVATIIAGQIHIVGAGTATITATQLGDSTYKAATAATRTLTVGKAAQTITFGALSAAAYGDADFAPGATASSGLAVTYASSNALVATIVSGKIHIVGAGTTTITATQTGNTNYNAATAVAQALTVGKGSQTITFPALGTHVKGEADFAPAATASSKLAVTYASDNTAVATIVYGKVHLVGAGTATITASQTGDTKWNAATPVAQTLTVVAGQPVITWSDKTATYGTALSATQLNATANVPGAFTYTLDGVTTVTATSGAKPAAGAHTLTVSFVPTNTATYGAGPFTKTVNLTVAKATATVTLTASSLTQAYNNQPCRAAATTTPAGLKVAFTYNGSSALPVDVGSYAVVGTVDDPNYQGSAKGTLAIKIVAPTVTAAKLVSLTGTTALLEVTCAAGVTHFWVEENAALAPAKPAIGDASWRGTTLVTATGAKTVFRGTIDLKAVTGTHPLVFWAKNAGTAAVSATAFKLSVTLPGPAITAFAPTSLPAGEVLTITGTAFGTAFGDVQFSNGTATPSSATVASWSATSIRCVVPEGLAGLASTSVTVVSAAGVASVPKTLTLTSFHLGAWIGTYTDGLSNTGDFIAHVTAGATASAFTLKLNNRSYACTVTSVAGATPLTFTGTSAAITSISLPAATCTGTVTVGTPTTFHVTTSDGSTYNGFRPTGTNPSFAGVFLMRAPTDTYGELWQFVNGTTVLPKVIVTGESAAWGDIVDDVLVAGDAAGQPASLQLRATAWAAGQVQTLDGRIIDPATGTVDSNIASKLLVAATGLANGTTTWDCARTDAQGDPFVLSIAVTGNSVTVSGTDNGTPFTMTGKIYREYDGTKCYFHVYNAAGASVREAKGVIDGSSLSFSAYVRDPNNTDVPPQVTWGNIDCTGTKR